MKITAIIMAQVFVYSALAHPAEHLRPPIGIKPPRVDTLCAQIETSDKTREITSMLAELPALKIGVSRGYESKRERRLFEIAEVIVKDGAIADAEAYLMHFTYRMRRSYVSQVGIIAFAVAVRSYGKAQHLRLLEPLLDTLANYAIISKGRDYALCFVTSAFACEGNIQSLEKLKSLLPKLIPHVSIVAIQEAVIGIDNVVARYGTEEDVRHCVTLFKSMDDKTANRNIYYLALEIQQHGSRARLLPLLDLSLWARDNQYSCDSLNDSVLEIGLACLTHGHIQEIITYVQGFINELPDKARQECWRISESIVQYDDLRILINPYLTTFASHLEEGTRKIAIRDMAFLVARDGNEKQIEEYLNVFMPAIRSPDGQTAIKKLATFMHRYPNAQQTEQRERLFALEGLLVMQETADFTVNGHVLHKEQAIDLIAGGHLTWGQGQWDLTLPRPADTGPEDVQIVLEERDGQPVGEEEQSLPPIEVAVSDTTLETKGLKISDLKHTQAWEKWEKRNKNGVVPVFELVNTRQLDPTKKKQFRGIPKSDHVVLEYKGRTQKCIRYSVVIGKQKDIQVLAETGIEAPRQKKEFECRVDVYRDYILLDLFMPFVLGESREEARKAIVASLSRDFPGVRIRMHATAHMPDEVQWFEKTFKAQLRALTGFDYKEGHVDDQTGKNRPKVFSYNPKSEPEVLIQDICLLIGSLVEHRVLTDDDKNYIVEKINKDRSSQDIIDAFHNALMERFAQRLDARRTSPLQYLADIFNFRFLADFSPTASLLGNVVIEGIIPLPDAVAPSIVDRVDFKGKGPRTEL